MSENIREAVYYGTRIPENGNDGFYSIGELSEITGVPPHTLRFWEKEMPDLLRPNRTAGGQRRYDSKMAELVQMIKRLSNEKKYSLAAIREQLGTTQRIRKYRPNSARKMQTERAVQLIIDEIADVLKERLLNLFATDEPEEGVNIEK